MSYNLIALLPGLIALGLSVWVVLPAPIAPLLPLSVGAPEISPWLVGVNGILLGGYLYSWRQLGAGKLGAIALALITLALIASLIPLSQWPQINRSAQQAMAATLGPDEAIQAMPGVVKHQRTAPFSLAALLKGIQPAPGRHHQNIPFASPAGVSLKLDIYQPEAAGTYPAVVIIYGGAWQRGSPEDSAQLGRYLAAQGYVVWAIDYRHAPQHPFPAQLEDVQTALAFLIQHAAEYDTDPTRIALFGKSAGAHLAMLAAYQPDALPIRAVVNYYGPVDLLAGYYDLPKPDPLDTRSLLVEFLGGTPDQISDRYRAASPANFMTADLPPTLLIYGGKDRIVMSRFGQALADRLQAAGNAAVYIRLPWADHAFDAIFNGLSNQLALYYTERFLAWALR
ncbi:MAG: alpha/beta hydrolase [Cyanobacteria bacterium P01_D01_bin.6]